MAKTSYGSLGVRQLSGDELDLATAEALEWELVTEAAGKSDYHVTEQHYYITGDGSTIVADTWQPTKKPRQFMKLMLDYRIGVFYNKPRRKWKAVGCVDQASYDTNSEQTFSYGMTPAEALCRCLILLREAGGQSYYEKIQESLHQIEE